MYGNLLRSADVKYANSIGDISNDSSPSLGNGRGGTSSGRHEDISWLSSSNAGSAGGNLILSSNLDYS